MNPKEKGFWVLGRNSKKTSGRQQIIKKQKIKRKSDQLCSRQTDAGRQWAASSKGRDVWEAPVNMD